MREVEVNALEMWIRLHQLRHRPSGYTSDVHQRSNAAEPIFIYCYHRLDGDLSRTPHTSIEELVEFGIFRGEAPNLADDKNYK